MSDGGLKMRRILIVCTTDSMIWYFLVPHIKELEDRGYYVECASSITGAFFDNLVRIHGIKMNEISFERSPYRLSNIKAYKALCYLIKEKKFDTIFCHEPVGGAMGRLAGHHCGCKVVYMAHGFHFYKGAPKSRKLYYLVEKFLSKYTDILVTINQEDYEASLRFHAQKYFKTNGIGVDTNKFKVCTEDRNYIKKEFNLPDDAVVMLSVGELIPRKNHEVIIKALSKIGVDNLFYMIAGDGEIKKDLERIINEHKLNDRVFLLGYRTDISLLCNSADIFALPSIHEGLSVALMEAMGCGKPVIGSKIRGNVDLIDENKGGFLVDTYDVDGYAQRIKLLFSDEETRLRMGKYNTDKVKMFDIEPVKEQIFAIIDEE